MTPTLIIYAKQELSCKELLPAYKRPWWELPFWWTHLLICLYNQFSNRGAVPLVSEMISCDRRIFTTLIYSHPWIILGTPRWYRTAWQCRRLKRLSMIPGWGRSPGGGNGNPLQHSCLKNNPMDRGAWWAAIHGVTKRVIFTPHP